MSAYTKTVEIAPLPPPPNDLDRLIGHLREAAECAQYVAEDMVELLTMLIASAERRRHDRRAA